VNQTNQYKAEIIEATITSFVAQSWVWDQFCPFGSVVTVESKKMNIFGIVYHIQTGSADSSRQPFAYQKRAEQLEKEQPQIFSFLRTTFSALPIGYATDNRMVRNLAHSPCTIHSFVRTADQNELALLFESTDYLHHLFALQAPVFNLDELLLAILMYQKSASLLTKTSIHQFFHTYSLLIGNEYRRIKLFSSKIETLFAEH
jgi:hypothetical protein